MKLTTIRRKSKEIAALFTNHGFIPLDIINKRFNKQWETNLFAILSKGQFDDLLSWYNSEGIDFLLDWNEQTIPLENVNFGPLYRHPKKIWGIGLNYVDHASDLSEKAPTSIPASFMKSETTIIGPRDEIKIPLQSNKTTGEAELGVIFKKRCKTIEKSNWKEVIAGFTTILDMTAEDILRKNPRYLTLSKNFDTFFSFGPQLITPDEIKDLSRLEVATVLNGTIHAKNVISNMTFPPDFLVSFHTHAMTMLPGDIISTGTPRAVPLNHGDIIECRIDGFMPLKNPVIDLKSQ